MLIIRNLFFLTLISLVVAILAPFNSFADQPVVGRKAAAKYFEKEAKENQATKESRGPSENYMMLHLGSYTASQAYNWKNSGSKLEDVGKATYGVTYLFDQWAGLDVNIRVDFTEFDLANERALKMSLLPIWTFPRAETNFPLYFGFGAGLGVFFQQVPSKSNIALDYQLLTGLRFFNLANSVGFFVEYGLKNHFHVLSEGQLNGTAFSGGAVFNF